LMGLWQGVVAMLCQAASRVLSPAQPCCDSIRWVHRAEFG
jgi:hypothetical protein